MYLLECECLILLIVNVLLEGAIVRVVLAEVSLSGRRLRQRLLHHRKVVEARTLRRNGGIEYESLKGISSEIRTKLRDWAVWQAKGGCYSQAASSSNDSKTL